MNTLVYPDFLSSEIPNCDMASAAFSVLPVPFEKSVSYGGGAELGPSSILVASEQLEVWDGKSNPSALGIHTCSQIDCSVSDDEVIVSIADAVTKILKAGSMPVVIGGEHTVTYGVIKGYLDAGFRDFGVGQIDAHADLRDAYEGNPLSHASVMKRVVDEGIPLYQLGIRAFCEEEKQAREKYGVAFQDAEKLVCNNVQSIQLPTGFPKKVFFTLDIDGMEPSVFPSTGTPIPGGLAWYQTLNIFESIAKQREIIGFDLMEFAPIEGFHAYDFSAALLLYKMMGIVSRNQ